MTELEKAKAKKDEAQKRVDDIQADLTIASIDLNKAHDEYVAAVLKENGTPIGSKYGKIIVEDCEFDSLNGGIKKLLGPRHDETYRSHGIYLEEWFVREKQPA